MMEKEREDRERNRQERKEQEDRAERERVRQLNLEKEKEEIAERERIRQHEENQREHELAMARLKAEENQAADNGERRNVNAEIVKPPKLPTFNPGVDKIDCYLERFERYAETSQWKPEAWATRLSALLIGEALEVYTRLSRTDAVNYDEVKKALLKRFNFTEEGYRQKFRDCKPETGETPSQFI